MSADSSLSCVAIAILAQCAVLVLDIFKAITSARFTTNSLGLSDNVISYIERAGEKLKPKGEQMFLFGRKRL
jgi:hypothetical protein